MDSSTLLWTVDATRGSVNFGRLIPFAGNTYELVFAGVAIEEEYTAYVMDESGLKCLAKSEHNAGEYTIAFNTADLRGEFERNMHEMQTFHVIVRDSKRVVAEGDLSVQWQSLWEDTTTSEVFTMRGPKGNPGAPGVKGEQGLQGLSAYDVAIANGFNGSEEEWLKTLKGAPGSLVRVQKIDENGEETGKWHNVFVKPDQNGRLRIVIGKTEHEMNASNDVYVSTMADMDIGGQKRFLESPIVPVILNGENEVDVTDDSGKAVNTKWIRAWWTKIWEGILSATQKFSSECTFLSGIVGNLKGNVVGNLKGTADKAIADENGRKIDETYLQLSGGTLTGAVAFTKDVYLHKKNDTGYLALSAGEGWDGGGMIVLRGKNSTEGIKGEISLHAYNGTNRFALNLQPNGSMTWGGKAVERMESSSFATDKFYIKYSSGLLIQGGCVDKGTPTGNITVSLAASFKDANYHMSAFMVRGANAADNTYGPFLGTTKNTTSFNVLTQGSCGAIEWLAIGRWK